MKSKQQFNFNENISIKEELSLWDCVNISAIIMSFIGALMNSFSPTSGMAMTMEVTGYVLGGFYISKILKTDQSLKVSMLIFLIGVGLCSIFLFVSFDFSRIFHHAASIVAFTGSFGLFKYYMNYHTR